MYKCIQEADDFAQLSAVESMGCCHAGTGISLAGVFIYSQVKRMSGKKKVAAA